jgi:hypothetical protein
MFLGPFPYFLHQGKDERKEPFSQPVMASSPFPIAPSRELGPLNANKQIIGREVERMKRQLSLSRLSLPQSSQLTQHIVQNPNKNVFGNNAECNAKGPQGFLEVAFPDSFSCIFFHFTYF